MFTTMQAPKSNQMHCEGAYTLPAADTAYMRYMSDTCEHFFCVNLCSCMSPGPVPECSSQDIVSIHNLHACHPTSLQPP